MTQPRYSEPGIPHMEISFMKKHLLKDIALPNWQKYQESGIAKMQQNDLEGAINDFSKAICKGPRNSALHYLRGTAYAQLNKDTDAIKDFKIILELEPINQTVQLLLKKSEKKLAIKHTMSPDQVSTERAR